RQAQRRRGPSVFLEEVREVCEAGAGRVALWTDPPGDDEHNPELVEDAPVVWPPDGETRRDAAARAADLVTRYRNGAWERELGLLDRAVLRPAARRRIRDWARDVELLLRHRAAEPHDGRAVEVELPAHLTVSALVSLARDPAALARQIRRPLPRPPAPHTRRGTAFHTWLERRFGQQSLVDPDELPGAADDPVDVDTDLEELQRRFEQSEWADRTPLEVEVSFETGIGDRLVRGRMDAVFHDPDSGVYDVVDWKTGQPPATARERRAVAVQLAAYRVAWARIADVPLDRVRAAFHYVRHDETVRPADLLDAAGLAALIDAVPEPGAEAADGEGPADGWGAPVPARRPGTRRPGSRSRPGVPDAARESRRQDRTRKAPLF